MKQLLSAIMAGIALGIGVLGVGFTSSSSAVQELENACVAECAVRQLPTGGRGNV